MRSTAIPGWLARSCLISFAAMALLACSPAIRTEAQVAPVCTESRDPVSSAGPVLEVAIENDPALPPFVAAWAYAPSAISAKVGQVIRFTNIDPDTQHSAELTSGDCGTDYLGAGASDTLVITRPGSYPFYCLVHGTAMTGTITIHP